MAAVRAVEGTEEGVREAAALAEEATVVGVSEMVRLGGGQAMVVATRVVG